MMRVGSSSIADHLGNDRCVPALRMLERFQNEHSSAFAERQAIPFPIEGPASSGREGLQGIEAGEHEMTERVISAGERSFGMSAAQEVPGMTNRVGARGAGIGNNRDRTGNAQ